MRLSSGRACAVARPGLPLLRDYYVLHAEETDAPLDARELDEMWLLALRIARELALRHHGDPECYTLLASGARTRRRPWPHFHIVPARSVAHKRWVLFLLWIKPLLLLLRGQAARR